MGGYATGTMQEFISLAREEQRSTQSTEHLYLDSRWMITNMLKDHGQIINIRADADKIADEYHGMGTNDFLIGLLQKHEKMAWMLRAYLE